MDYEQKYKEALETARKINSGEGVAAPPDWTVYEVIFPELRESEEEKVRKEIIKLVKFYYGSSLALKHTVSKDEMAAWLEEQKTSEEAIKYLEENHSPSEISDFQAAINQEIKDWLEKQGESKLAGCEDDRIRKVIRGWIYTRPNSFFDNGISKEEMLSWLEKQDESIKIKKGKNYLCTKTHKYAGVEWIKGTKYYASDNYTLVNQGCEYYCPEYSKEKHNNFFEEVKYDDCDEKQSETLCDKCKKEQHSHSCQDITALGRCYIDGMNTANKIKPKFHKDEWVVNNATLNLCHILRVEHGQYICDDCSFPITKENDYHLWTIANAEEGDVLATENFIFIFKNIDDDNGVHYYCHYEINKHEDDNQFGIALPQSLMGRIDNSISHYSPATKEQRDLLFSKMRDEGCEWDEANKKLTKKIGDVEKIHNDSLNCQNVLLNWSEEDDKIFNKIINSLLGAENVDCAEYNIMYNWLISIKKRMQ